MFCTSGGWKTQQEQGWSVLKLARQPQLEEFQDAKGHSIAAQRVLLQPTTRGISQLFRMPNSQDTKTSSTR
jgi:hypothetical protein